MAVAAAVGAAMAAAAVPAAGQDARPVAGDTGELVVRRVVATDTSKSYALYLPPGYEATRPWPALLLMDPRGRALVPLERFRPIAAELGYVVLSSYDTSSDQPTSFSESEAAVEAMVNDAAASISLDLGRLYLVGFSGTARLAWALAAASPSYFPAIVSFGAALLPSMRLLLDAQGRALPPAFMGAGRLDFNYGEVWEVGELLEGRGIPHVVVPYPGPHAWPPEPVARAAVEWLEIRAQQTGLAILDAAWVRSRFRASQEAAEEAERAGRLHDAFLAWYRVAGTFAGFRIGLDAAVDSAREAAVRLSREPDVRRANESLHRALAREPDVMARVRAVTDALDGSRVPSVDALARRLDVRSLRDETESGDTLTAQAAGRALALAYANAVFYIPRDLLARGDTAAALRSLELAHRIEPEYRGVCGAFDGLAARSRASDELARFCEPGG